MSEEILKALMQLFDMLSGNNQSLDQEHNP